MSPSRFGSRQPLNQKGDLLAAKLQRNVLLFVDTTLRGYAEGKKSASCYSIPFWGPEMFCFS
jgi:hypothetical protein